MPLISRNRYKLRAAISICACCWAWSSKDLGQGNLLKSAIVKSSVSAGLSAGSLYDIPGTIGEGIMCACQVIQGQRETPVLASASLL